MSDVYTSSMIGTLKRYCSADTYYGVLGEMYTICMLLPRWRIHNNVLVNNTLTRIGLTVVGYCRGAGRVMLAATGDPILRDPCVRNRAGKVGIVMTRKRRHERRSCCAAPYSGLPG